ncbi:GNAT family N-acetyltransferase [Mycetocola reblochoni]|uniref:GNAT family N-acetyltransferase n=1 Tax=Mycetocola reblochoni TaxID=331618 RepID=UPI0015C5A9E8|nr:GNAT family N-acetyltransferase [Mycetocola reblochoni]
MAKPHHSHELQQFVCTTPPKKLHDKYRGNYHPKPWALEVQSAIRNIRPHGRDTNDLIRLGHVDGRLAHVSELFFSREERTLAILLIATHREFQGTGLGAQSLEKTVELFNKLRDDNHADELVARIHQSNDPSKGLFEKAGFAPGGSVSKDSDYVFWMLADG